MSEQPVHVTRALLVALLEEIGDDDPCGRAIVETALEFGDVLSEIGCKTQTGRPENYALDALLHHCWTAPQ
jgi:hypothetical protein